MILQLSKPQELFLCLKARPDCFRIVAVHGLAAHPHKTWTWRPPGTLAVEHDLVENAGQKSVNWLEDLLPDVLPSTQINTFNYASDGKKDAPKESLRNIALKLLSALHAQRVDDAGWHGKPLVFIGHSFGGLVIQQVSIRPQESATL